MDVTDEEKTLRSSPSDDLHPEVAHVLNCPPEYDQPSFSDFLGSPKFLTINFLRHAFPDIF